MQGVMRQNWKKRKGFVDARCHMAPHVRLCDVRNVPTWMKVSFILAAGKAWVDETLYIHLPHVNEKNK